MAKTADQKIADAISAREAAASDSRNPGILFHPDDPSSQSVTNQSDKDSTDLNLMFKRYEKTGLITVNGNSRQPNYGDFSNVGDFHALQNTIAKTQQAFDALPASTRSRFNNDPAQLVDFLADPANDKEAVALKLKDPTVLPQVNDDLKKGQENGTIKKDTQAPPAAAPGQPANPAA